MRRTWILLLPILFTSFAMSCDKPASPPGPKSFASGTASNTATWPEEPGGPLWEALARVPAWEGGTIGILDFSAALKPHPAWGEAGHGRAAREFENFFVKESALPAADVSDLIWAELRVTDRNGYERVWIAKVATVPERFRDAMGARGFTPAEGVEGGWTRSPEADSNPEHVALRDGWLVRTFAGPDLFAKILDTWNGKCANARSLAHARTLVAGLPPSKPAVLRFGIEDQPLPDSPLRVIAMVMAPDAATGEEVVVVAFNAASGPETMLASDSWKKLMGRLTTPPRADRKEECLRIATRPEADPGFVEGRRKEVEARLLGLRSALDAYKIDQGRYPDSLARLTEIEFPSFTDDLWDPWGHAWIYELRENSFVVRSAGPDCRDGTADDIALPADR